MTTPSLPHEFTTSATPLTGAPVPSSPASISAAELAALIEAFNEVTTKLTRTHEQLQGEIATLREQLTDAKAQAERSRHLAMLGEMAAGIAHEIRNPLGSIRLYARMLRDDLASQPAPLAVAEKIDLSVVRLEHVVGDVLAFARELRTRAVGFDAADLVEASVESARSGSPAWANLTIEIKPSSQSLTGDPDLLRQALVNLIRNAAEAMAEHKVTEPKIEISVQQRKVRDSNGDVRLMSAVCVADNGPGVPLDVLPRLFEPFFTTRSDGTGLGLAIVHRIVDAHGGRVTARNLSGGSATPAEPAPSSLRGALFEIMLPADSGHGTSDRRS